MLYIGSHGGRGGSAPYKFLEFGDSPTYGDYNVPKDFGSGGGFFTVRRGEERRVYSMICIAL